MLDSKKCCRTAEAEDSRRLWEAIFSEDSAEFLDYYDQWKMRDNRRETRYRDGRLVSMVHWNPYQICVRGHQWDSYYIVAVATLPEYRHQGLMADQLREGLRRFRSEKVPFLFLMPANPAIYTPFDFRYIYDKKVAEREGLTAEGTLRVRPLREQEWEQAAAFANEQLGRQFEVYARRDEALLERTQAECASEGGALEGIFAEDELVGILDWWGDTSVEIREIILTESWEKQPETVWGAIGRRWPEAEDVTMVTTGWDGAKKPIIMARIVDLAVFLQIFTAAQEQEAVIRMTDEILEENNGVFCWKIGPEGSELVPVNAETATRRLGDADAKNSVEEDLEISVADLMSWLSGYEQPENLMSLHRTEKGENFMKQVQVIRGVFLPEIV